MSDSYINNLYCTFHLDEHVFCVSIDNVQEVLTEQIVTPVPLSEDYIHGLVNLRGQIFVAIDLRKRFYLPPLDSIQETMNLVLTDNNGMGVNLVVDTIGDVIEINLDYVDDVPANLNKEIKELLSGVYNHNDTNVLIVNNDKLINTFGEQAAGLSGVE